MFELFWEMHQQGKIIEAKGQASQAQYEAQTLASKVGELEHAVERLLLVNRAMWEMMQENLGVTMGQLSRKVHEVDLRDGVLDGKFTGKMQQLRCPACGRDQHSRHARCLYCGTALSGGDVFDSVK